MEDVLEQNEINSNEPRPVFLIVLCILSYIWIGFSLLFTLLSVSHGPSTKDEMISNKARISKSMNDMREAGMESWIPTFKKIEIMSEKLNENYYLMTAISVLALLLGLFGVISMWKGKKNGFHFYIIYSILASCQVYFFVSPDYVPTFLILLNLIISGLFVFMYSRNLHWLK